MGLGVSSRPTQPVEIHTTTVRMIMDSDVLPSEIKDRLSAFDDGLNNIEEILNELHEVPMPDLHIKVCCLAIFMNLYLNYTCSKNKLLGDNRAFAGLQ